MISSAIVQSVIVLANRRMNAERDVMMLVPVCSSVEGMHLHHPERANKAQAQMTRLPKGGSASPRPVQSPTRRDDSEPMSRVEKLDGKAAFISRALSTTRSIFAVTNAQSVSEGDGENQIVLVLLQNRSFPSIRKKRAVKESRRHLPCQNSASWSLWTLKEKNGRAAETRVGTSPSSPSK
jgi:hypothetical protein